MTTTRDPGWTPTYFRAWLPEVAVGVFSKTGPKERVRSSEIMVLGSTSGPERAQIPALGSDSETSTSRSLASDWGPITCRVDLSASGEVFLGSGTAEFCRHIATRIGVNVHQVLSWQVRRYCTCFYTNTPDDNADWVDRFPISWQVDINLTGRLPEFELQTDYIPIQANDPTWEWEPDYWIPKTEECVVLAISVANSAEGIVKNFADQLGDQFPGLLISTREMTGSGKSVLIGQIHLGSLDVEDEFEKIVTIKRACTAMGFATDLPAYEHMCATNF
jgi:hypothetical protein